jgi:hypothetical protein
MIAMSVWLGAKSLFGFRFVVERIKVRIRVDPILPEQFASRDRASKAELFAHKTTRNEPSCIRRDKHAFNSESLRIATVGHDASQHFFR